MKKLIILLLVAFPMALMAQAPELVKSFTKMDDPVYIIDSVRSTKIQLGLMNTDDILQIAISKDPDSLTVGKYGSRGIVFITTKQFAKKVYLEKFALLSADYKAYVADKKGDDSVAYIINGRKIGNDNSRLIDLYSASGKAIEGFIFRKIDNGLSAAVTITAK